MPPPRGLIQFLDQQLHRTPLLPRNARLLIAVSGGADSVALLHLLHTINRSRYWNWTLIVAHIDHGIRGRASTLDATFVRKLSRELHLPCTIKRLHLKKSASEATARTARFRALKAIAKSKRCDAVVMAHHADDQAETVLLKLFRGCGLDGLSGIAPQVTIDGLPICRPLLSIRRSALRGYLIDIGQQWREDATNTSDAYLRNRLRSELLPKIENLAPKAIDALTRLATLAREAQDLITAQAANLFNAAALTRTKKKVVFHRTQLRAAPQTLAAETLRIALAHVGGSTESADFERIREAVRMIHTHAGGKTIQIGGGVTVHAIGGQHGHVIVEKAKPQ